MPFLQSPGCNLYQLKCSSVGKKRQKSFEEQTCLLLNDYVGIRDGEPSRDL